MRPLPHTKKKHQGSENEECEHIQNTWDQEVKSVATETSGKDCRTAPPQRVLTSPSIHTGGPVPQAGQPSTHQGKALGSSDDRTGTSEIGPQPGHSHTGVQGVTHPISDS